MNLPAYVEIVGYKILIKIENHNYFSYIASSILNYKNLNIMKKIYFLAFALTGMIFSASAQNEIFNDDMESYPLGPLSEGHWGTWSGTDAENIIIVATHSNSGSQSGMIGDDGVQDAILKLGNESEGMFTVAWQNYVPSGKRGYYNFQEQENPGAGAWAINVHFNYDNANAGTAWVIDDQNPANVVAAFTYPEDTWFKLTHVIDLDGDMVTMYMDGVEVYNGPFYSGGNLGGVDFFSIDNNNELYIDDAFYAEGEVVATEDFVTESFSIYPNPVVDFLHINSKTAVDNIIVYDILGKVVLKSTPATISPKLDMTSLPSGAYLVKVTIGKDSKTVKILK